jgi:hypothetical protein
MTVEEIARTLCEPPLHQPDFERALSLFSFQIELLFPRRLKVASYARLHAAVKFLEYITNEQDPNALALVKRSSHKGHEEYLRRVFENEGGIFGLGRSWSRRELTDQIDGQDFLSKDMIPSRLAYSISEVVQTSGLGRTLVFAEIKAGRLIARKCGRRTVILDEDLRQWLKDMSRCDTHLLGAH